MDSETFMEGFKRRYKLAASKLSDKPSWGQKLYSIQQETKEEVAEVKEVWEVCSASEKQVRSGRICQKGL